MKAKVSRPSLAEPQKSEGITSMRWSDPDSWWEVSRSMGPCPASAHCKIHDGTLRSKITDRVVS